MSVNVAQSEMDGSNESLSARLAEERAKRLRIERLRMRSQQLQCDPAVLRYMDLWRTQTFLQKVSQHVGSTEPGRDGVKRCETEDRSEVRNEVESALLSIGVSGFVLLFCEDATEVGALYVPTNVLFRSWRNVLSKDGEDLIFCDVYGTHGMSVEWQLDLLQENHADSFFKIAEW